MTRRRGFGEVERRVGASKKVTYRARYAMPDGSRFSRTLATRMDAEDPHHEQGLLQFRQTVTRARRSLGVQTTAPKFGCLRGWLGSDAAQLLEQLGGASVAELAKHVAVLGEGRFGMAELVGDVAGGASRLVHQGA